jgi:phosphosulfolactate phosphohydrolase-like enzyme
VLEGAAVNFEEIKPKILASHGADRLRGIGREEDIAFCTRLDTTDIVPVVDRKSGVIRVGK